MACILLDSRMSNLVGASVMAEVNHFATLGLEDPSEDADGRIMTVEDGHAAVDQADRAGRGLDRRPSIDRVRRRVQRHGQGIHAVEEATGGRRSSPAARPGGMRFKHLAERIPKVWVLHPDEVAVLDANARPSESIPWG